MSKGWTARVDTLLHYYSSQLPPYTRTFVSLPEVRSASPTGLVPILTVRSLSHNQELQIADTLAISEFLAEHNPNLPLWPQDPCLRAMARSIVAQMHSGFHELRNTFHTNFVAKYEGPIPMSEKSLDEIQRLFKMWSTARRETVKQLFNDPDADGVRDEGFLFGPFGIADAFFWPVLWRFRTYNLPLSGAPEEVLQWMNTMWEDPKLKELGNEYFEQAKHPETRTEKYEDIFKDIEGVKFDQVEADWKFISGESI